MDSLLWWPPGGLKAPVGRFDSFGGKDGFGMYSSLPKVPYPCPFWGGLGAFHALLWCTPDAVCDRLESGGGPEGPMYEDMGSIPLLERPVEMKGLGMRARASFFSSFSTTRPRQYSSGINSKRVPPIERSWVGKPKVPRLGGLT